MNLINFIKSLHSFTYIQDLSHLSNLQLCNKYIANILEPFYSNKSFSSHTVLVGYEGWISSHSCMNIPLSVLGCPKPYNDQLIHESATYSVRDYISSWDASQSKTEWKNLLNHHRPKIAKFGKLEPIYEESKLLHSNSMENLSSMQLQLFKAIQPLSKSISCVMSILWLSE